MALMGHHRSVIALVIIHRCEERAFFVGRYERAAMLFIMMEAIIKLNNVLSTLLFFLQQTQRAIVSSFVS